MPLYEVKWTIKKTAVIEADNPGDAQEKAENQLDCVTDGDYYEDSFNILDIREVTERGVFVDNSYVKTEDDPAAQRFIPIEDEDEWNYRETHKAKNGY